jgi:hypothetical protein
MHPSHCPQLQHPGIRNPVSIYVDSNESGTPLPPLRVCYAGRVVWCQWVTTERELDVINHKSPEAWWSRVMSYGRGLKLCLPRKILPWVYPSDIWRIISLMWSLRWGVAEVFHLGIEWSTPSVFLFLSLDGKLMPTVPEGAPVIMTSLYQSSP